MGAKKGDEKTPLKINNSNAHTRGVSTPQSEPYARDGWEGEVGEGKAGG